MSPSEPTPRKVVVVGAGPVGCLAAIAFAKQGWKVDLYEGRPDLRLPSSKAANQQRSINLAMSHRGIAALEAVDPALTQRFLQTVIPMRGREPSFNNRLLCVLTLVPGQCINSIDRALLNEELLQEASASPNISIFFKHKVVAAYFDQKRITMRNLESGQEFPVDFDFCIGADGSYSVIRRQMMRVVSSDLDRLNNPEIILGWFKLHFPDALSMIGEETLVDDFTRNPRSPLICTKSKPYHYQDRVIILGDAAHSMVPFYGQGLNCGLEDVRILMTLLLQEGVKPTAPPIKVGTPNGVDQCLVRALDRYSDTRHEDLIAICDLAMDN
ncbi:hypothetical protein DXG01_014533 [Tephrocybe rancida]|nr:hypothetical protein DXG01_014533 [Tephrocybe rancida]